MKERHHYAKAHIPIYIFREASTFQNICLGKQQAIIGQYSSEHLDRFNSAADIRVLGFSHVETFVAEQGVGDWILD